LARAKVNLTLHVGEKRADGFHELQSLVVFASVGDALTFERADSLSLALEGPFAAALGEGADNLILKAARLLASPSEMGARITLTKNLPVSSGIGGGSADAAAALRGLTALWDLEPTEEALSEMTAALGSDVPVCLASRPAWMEGRGERLTPIDQIHELPIVLANPGVAVPTGKVFEALSERRGVSAPKPLSWKSPEALLADLKRAGNDLEAPARAIAPEIGSVLDALGRCDGVQLARMSGSGATCFAVFGTAKAAASAAKALKSGHSGWWIVATKTLA
jgi:4-diphosphocytidyl-2-C-methyl-D-erythritol kinase